ncbi:MAG: MerR family transcriptional regulator [Chloroflexi bacterium]|nr:MAG: MerR family transcriptional regulator [Chloroflexota bacterium]
MGGARWPEALPVSRVGQGCVPGGSARARPTFPLAAKSRYLSISLTHDLGGNNTRHRNSTSGEQHPVAEAQTHDALTQVLIANDGEVLARLRLSAAEAARVCNVTPRQLIYWTKKGLVKPSTDGDHDYDVFAMEKVIRIRQALEKGHSLEKAAQLVQREISTLQAEAKRLEEMPPDALEDELRTRLERLEARINELRRALPASLTIARLRKAVAVLARLDAQGALEGTQTNGDSAKAVALRLGRAIDELELLLREVQPVGA